MGWGGGNERVAGSEQISKLESTKYKTVPEGCSMGEMNVCDFSSKY